MRFVKLYCDSMTVVDDLSEAEAGRLLKAILHYADTETVDQLPGQERLIFGIVKAQIDRDRETSNRKAEANRVNGIKGGRPANMHKEKHDSLDGENPTKPNITQLNPPKPNITQLNPPKPNKRHNPEDPEDPEEPEQPDARGSSSLSFLPEEDAVSLAAGLQDVLDAAAHAGFQQDGATVDKLNLLAADYSSPWVLAAIDQCNDAGKTSLGYLRAILERFRKEGGASVTGRASPADTTSAHDRFMAQFGGLECLTFKG